MIILIRFYDYTRKAMFEVDSLKHINGRLIAYCKAGIGGVVGSDKISELMQYIGLRDQRRTQEFPDGLRIYEGDVVNRGCFCEGKPDELSVVVFDQPMARWRWEGFGHNKGRGLYPNTSVSRHAKVIGNIHENPELLE